MLTVVHLWMNWVSSHSACLWSGNRLLCPWAHPGSPHISLPSDGNPGGEWDASRKQRWQLLCKKAAPPPRIGRCQKVNTSLVPQSPDHRSWSSDPTHNNCHLPGRPIGAECGGWCWFDAMTTPQHTNHTTLEILKWYYVRFLFCVQFQIPCLRCDALERSSKTWVKNRGQAWGSGRRQDNRSPDNTPWGARRQE